ncbi:SRPBCC family protein [Maritimibacter sp. DP1N21-5]|uniref:SRPBCC family protein n=1 Tax=Maritimibacter sp. DP1N21-5 TaxID=2836867 RepID=UPI001C47E47A|nr:SRPBCC family protein [Maritimibacter sp. DP1N21-5]MBV7408499.1 SRPBCC family protein [Maritimibacter sp. DP1N21-5]
MKLTTREDIAAPIEAVFANVADFAWFERAAMRRGVDVVRTDSLTTTGTGMSWHAEFSLRGRDRKVDVDLADYDPPEKMKLILRSAGLEVEALIDFVAMSRSRTRMNVTMDATPKTIPARLMIQSAKLARTNILKRYRRRVAEYAAELEERCHARGF